MKCSVAKVFFSFLEHTADAFLLGDVIVQLLNVPFSLFSALAFSLFRVSRRSLHFAHVTVVAEVNDDDDRNADEERPESDCAKTANDKSGARRTGKVTDRNPKKVTAPHVPEPFVCLERTRDRTDSCVDQVLDHPHYTKSDDRKRSSTVHEVGGGSKNHLKNRRRREHGARE